MEKNDAGLKDLMKDVSTEALIEELKTRNLTQDNISLLQTFKPTEKTDVPEIKTDINTSIETVQSAEKFVKAVERKNAFGKLPSGSTIDSKSIEGLGGGFYDHGPDKMELPKAENGVSSMQNNILYQKQDKFSEQMGSHLVTVAPSEANHANMVLTIRFFQDRKQIDGRGWCTPAHVSVEIPNNIMSEFVNEIQKNPDLLEDFYKKTFEGLDGSNDQPGMRRIKANGFYLITGDKLAEATEVDKYNETLANRFFNSLQKLKYQNGPYGSGDEFKPR